MNDNIESEYKAIREELAAEIAGVFGKEDF